MSEHQDKIVLEPHDYRRDIAAALLTGLVQYTGSETCYRHPLMRNIRITEGVKFVADTAGAHWLTDIIASHQLDPKVRAEEFQVWTLTVDLTKTSGKIVMTDGNKNVIITQDIACTSFPLPEMVIWFTNKTLLLPGEY